jgi:glycosyltransferase involved in cell wall biosynthesis
MSESDVKQERETTAPPPQETLSVILCVYNEGHQIARCLDALTWADEVIVMDKFSTDDTEAVARRYSNVRFYQNEDWININVNLGIEKAKGDWILRMDADEVVSPEMAQEIQQILRNPDPRYSGYWAPNRVFFFGKWIRYGVAYDRKFGKERIGYCYRQVMYRKGAAKYACVGYHEELTTQAEFGRLKGHYDHYSHPSVSRWIAKMNMYTDGDTGRMDVLSPEFRMPRPGKTIVALIKIFFDLYVRRQGYRDGTHGFMTCALNTFYVLVERCKIWERHYKLTHPEEIVK